MSPKDKFYLKRVYLDFYNRIADEIPSRGQGLRILEIGSGSGFIKDVIPNCITSDILPGNDLVMEAEHIQVGNETLDAIILLNVFHHLEDQAEFLDEAARTLRQGGRLILVEPSRTLWARLVYRYHHEKESQFEAWEWFTDEIRSHPSLIGWRRIKIGTFCPFTYILSGGIKRKWSAPLWMYCPTRWLDRVFKSQGIFALYVLEKLT